MEENVVRTSTLIRQDVHLKAWGAEADTPYQLKLICISMNNKCLDTNLPLS